VDVTSVHFIWTMEIQMTNVHEWENLWGLILSNLVSVACTPVCVIWVSLCKLLFTKLCIIRLRYQLMIFLFKVTLLQYTLCKRWYVGITSIRLNLFSLRIVHTQLLEHYVSNVIIAAASSVLINLLATNDSTI